MGEDDAATRQGRRVGFVLGSVVYVQNSAGFHLGLIFLAISYNWCLWFSGWWFERFPLQALLSSSQTEGDEAAQALLCQLQGFYQRPISPRWIVNPFLSMKNNFWWREGPGWQQNSSLCSSLHANSQTWEESCTILQGATGQAFSWSQRNSDTDGNGVLGVMDLSSLPGWVLFSHPNSSRTSWLCCHVLSSMGL